MGRFDGMKLNELKSYISENGLDVSGAVGGRNSRTKEDIISDIKREERSQSASNARRSYTPPQPRQYDSTPVFYQQAPPQPNFSSYFNRNDDRERERELERERERQRESDRLDRDRRERERRDEEERRRRDDDDRRRREQEEERKRRDFLDQIQKERSEMEKESARLRLELEKKSLELQKQKLASEEKISITMKNLKIKEGEPVPMEVDFNTARNVANLLNNVKTLNPSLLKIDQKQVLGSGSFGKVYRATYQNVKVAAKVIGHQSSIEESFQNETNTLSRLRHPNIVQCLGVIFDPTNYVIVMELIEGKSLDKLLRDRKKANSPLDHDLFIKFAKQLGYALNYLHMQNPPIIHNDVKSLNIMVTLTNDIKLVDFGLSKTKTANSATIATINAIQQIGTVLWCAPEQLSVKLRKSRGTKSDVYSFASVLLELLTLETPYEAEMKDQMTIEDIKQLVVDEKEKPEIPKTVSPMITKLMNSCWSWDPAARPTMEKVLSELDEINLPDPYPSIFAFSGANREELQDPTVTSVLLSVVQYVNETPKRIQTSPDNLLKEILNMKNKLKPPMPGKLAQIPKVASTELVDVLKRAIEKRRSAFKDSINSNSSKIEDSIWKDHLTSKLVNLPLKI